MSSDLRALIVDDEPVARRRLQRMLQRMKGVQPVGEAADGVEALEQTRNLKPDVILLDIRMPGLDGLTLAKTVSSLPPVIFTTAFDDHAVEAFEASAVDYLLKPINQERLAQALEKVRQRGGEGESKAWAALIRRLNAEPRPRLTARAGDVIRIFDPSEISRFQASDKYTIFHHDGQEFVLDESLSRLEERLNQLPLFRVHRSELVNLDHIKALRTEDGSLEIELADGRRVPVSRRQGAELKRRLGLAP